MVKGGNKKVKKGKDKNEKETKKGKKGKKGGANCFMKFMSEMREKIKVEHPDWKARDVSKEGGKRWKALSDEEKSAYK
jgi:hypothetical protein